MQIQSDIKKMITKNCEDQKLSQITLNFIENIKNNMIADSKAGEILMQELERFVKENR